MSLVGRPAGNHPQQVSRRGADDRVDDRWTPDEVFAPLHGRWSFTLDAAASDQNHKCPRYFTREDDGLSRTWKGARVWCNPPYSGIGAWVEKAWRAMRIEGAEVVVMLLPANRTEQGWWQDHVEPHRDRRRGGVRLDVAFLPGRPRFYSPHRKPSPKGDRPPFGLVVLTWSRA